MKRRNLKDKQYVEERDLLLEKANLILINEFWKIRLRLNIKCNCCNKSYSIGYSQLKMGVSCSCHQNKTESRIRNILENMFDCSFNYRSNKISELGKLSPDGYNSGLKLVLEFRGDQHYNKSNRWYSEQSIERYKQKMEIYRKLGLDLLEIFEYEVKAFNDFEISELIIKKLESLGRINIPKLKSDFVHIQNPKFMTYKEAQETCVINGIKSYNVYKKSYAKISNFLPCEPNKIYENSWISWGEFLKTRNTQGSKLNNKLSKKVSCIETGVIYLGEHAAYRLTGIRNTYISKCCLGEQKTAGGYHWEFLN